MNSSIELERSLDPPAESSSLQSNRFLISFISSTRAFARFFSRSTSAFIFTSPSPFTFFVSFIAPSLFLPFPLEDPTESSSNLKTKNSKLEILPLKILPLTLRHIAFNNVIFVFIIINNFLFNIFLLHCIYDLKGIIHPVKITKDLKPVSNFSAATASYLTKPRRHY